jgi:hypothetical protein
MDEPAVQLFADLEGELRPFGRALLAKFRETLSSGTAVESGRHEKTELVAQVGGEEGAIRRGAALQKQLAYPEFAP